MTQKTRVACLLRASAHVMAIGASIGIAQPAAAAAAVSQGPDALAPSVTQSADSANQTSSASMVADDIIVTARRRDETLTAVPVAITALTQKELQRSGVTDFRSLSSALPTLKTSEANSGAGGSIYIRGVGTTGGLSAGSEQAVSINVDCVQFSRGSILRLGLYDAAQIQVLRGPPALFFGKHSPAGVLSIPTADPSDHLEISGRARRPDKT